MEYLRSAGSIPFLCRIFVEQLCDGCADKPAGICGLFECVCVAAHFEQKIAVRQIHVVFALREQNRSHQSGIHRLAGLLQSYRKAQILFPVGEVFDLALLRSGDYHDLRRLFAVYLCGRLYLVAVAQMYRVAVDIEHDLNRRIFLEISLDIDS